MTSGWTGKLDEIWSTGRGKASGSIVLVALFAVGSVVRPAGGFDARAIGAVWCISAGRVGSEASGSCKATFGRGLVVKASPTKSFVPIPECDNAHTLAATPTTTTAAICQPKRSVHANPVVHPDLVPAVPMIGARAIARRGPATGPSNEAGGASTCHWRNCRLTDSRSSTSASQTGQPATCARSSVSRWAESSPSSQAITSSRFGCWCVVMTPVLAGARLARAGAAARDARERAASARC